MTTHDDIDDLFDWEDRPKPDTSTKATVRMRPIRLAAPQPQPEPRDELDSLRAVGPPLG